MAVSTQEKEQRDAAASEAKAAEELESREASLRQAQEELAAQRMELALTAEAFRLDQERLAADAAQQESGRNVALTEHFTDKGSVGVK